jgi:hypothetical protein
MVVRPAVIVQSSPPGGVPATTDPLPLPLPVTVSAKSEAGAAKLAVTFRTCVISTVQVGCVPAHAPVHRVKEWSVAGVAVRVTRVPWG